MRFSATPVNSTLAPAARQHTDEILRGVLRLDDTAIAKLKADGTI
jgi:crotonobetainyl-CoA:carnitine CoA-transferase CaiB-like acyl-CoA transferase